MTKKKPRYESRVFDGRVIHSAEIEAYIRKFSTSNASKPSPSQCAS